MCNAYPRIRIGWTQSMDYRNGFNMKILNIKIFRVFLLLSITLSLSTINAVNAASETSIAPLFDNIGQLHFPIETQSPLAQRYFEQGMILFYAFEYGEAIRSFRAATKIDPNCAMCSWGLALALGSKNGAVMNGRERDESGLAIKVARELV